MRDNNTPTEFEKLNIYLDWYITRLALDVQYGFNFEPLTKDEFYIAPKELYAYKGDWKFHNVNCLENWEKVIKDRKYWASRR